MTIIKACVFLESGIISQEVVHIVSYHTGVAKELNVSEYHSTGKEGTVMAPGIYISITPVTQDFKEL